MKVEGIKLSILPTPCIVNFLTKEKKITEKYTEQLSQSLAYKVVF